MKRTISALLSSVLVLSLLTVPASALGADGKPTADEARTHFSLTNDVPADSTYVETDTFHLASSGYNDEGERYSAAQDIDIGSGTGTYLINSYAGYNVILPDTNFTVTNTAQDIDCYVSIYMECYMHDYFVYESSGSGGGGVNHGTSYFAGTKSLKDGYYARLTERLQLAENGKWYLPELEADRVYLDPGESMTFDLAEIREWEDMVHPEDDNIYMISVRITYPDYQWYRQFSYLFHADAKAVASLGKNTPETDASISFDSSYAADDGVVYGYTLTNHTQQALDGYFALVSYSPKKYSSQTGETFISAQVHPIRISLNPGQTTTGHLTSEFGELSNKELIWVQFDSQDELDSFLSSPVLNRLTSGYGDRYTVSNDGGEEWLNANFGVTLK